MSAGVLPVPTAPAVPLLKADEFARQHAGDYVELIDGIVVELPVPFAKHGKVCFTVAYAIGGFVVANDLGHIMTNDSFVQTDTDPDRVRGADVCFFSYTRLPKGDIPDGLMPVPPDLVVEVRSQSDTWMEVFAKVLEYLRAGVRVVVVIDIPTRSASVYRTNAQQEMFYAGQDLTIPDVLPGFATPVGQLFG